jgi:hypothetical protein
MDGLMLVICAFPSAKECKLISMLTRNALALKAQ